MLLAICTSRFTECNFLVEIRIFERRNKNLRVSKRWKENYFWVRFASKFHHVFIKSIRMLDTSNYNEINAFEFEIFATKYDRDIVFVFAEFEIFEISLYFLIRFVFSSRSSSFWLRFIFVVVEIDCTFDWVTGCTSDLKAIGSKSKNRTEIALRSLLKIWSGDSSQYLEINSR